MSRSASCRATPVRPGDGTRTWPPPPRSNPGTGIPSGPRCAGPSTASPTQWCSRPPGSTTTRSTLAGFLGPTGTIYLMGSPGAQHRSPRSSPPSSKTSSTRHATKRRTPPTRRLESPLVLMLDECANIAPLGDLPKLAAELGGLGITTAVILQSVASARTIWGEAGERALRDLANITLVWGGQKDVAFLEEISRAGRRARRAGRDSPRTSGKVEFVDAASHAGAAHRGHRQPRPQPRGGRVPPLATTDRAPGVVAERPGPGRAGRIGQAGRLEDPRSCLRGSVTDAGDLRAGRGPRCQGGGAARRCHQAEVAPPASATASKQFGLMRRTLRPRANRSSSACWPSGSRARGPLRRSR